MANQPKPHHLKAVTGNPGRRPLGDPPAKLSGEVEMPPLLVRGDFAHAGRARELWADLSPALIQLEILNPVTAVQFGNWCELQARYEAEPSAFTASMLAQLRALGSEYGLGYVSYEKMSAGKGPKEEDAASRYIA